MYKNMCVFKSMSLLFMTIFFLSRLVGVSFGLVGNTNSSHFHQRTKRMIWVTPDGRLAFPPGTTLELKSIFDVPFIRNPPEDVSAGLEFTVSYKIDFDKLGLTDKLNPYGTWFDIFEKSYEKSNGVGDFVGMYFDKRKGKRSSDIFPDKVEKFFQTKFHGGERVLMYIYIEQALKNYGFSGKACLLRTICEVHSHSLDAHGLFGEVLHLFLTPSLSEHSKHMYDYLKAEVHGRERGECFPYFKPCPISIFSGSNVYTKPKNENTVSYQMSSEDLDEELQAM